MRQIRSEGRAGGGLTDAAAVVPFRLVIELDAVTSFYAAKIDAVKRGLSPSDIAGAVRAILDEQAVAVRAVLEKWNAARAVTKKPKAVRATVPMRPVVGYDPS